MPLEIWHLNLEHLLFCRFQLFGHRSQRHQSSGVARNTSRVVVQETHSKSARWNSKELHGGSIHSVSESFWSNFQDSISIFSSEEMSILKLRLWLRGERHFAAFFQEALRKARTKSREGSQEPFKIMQKVSKGKSRCRSLGRSMAMSGWCRSQSFHRCSVSL